MDDDWMVGRWMNECVAGLGTLVLLLGRERDGGIEEDFGEKQKVVGFEEEEEEVELRSI
jgi:hypothetical protein